MRIFPDSDYKEPRNDHYLSKYPDLAPAIKILSQSPNLRGTTAMVFRKDYADRMAALKGVGSIWYACSEINRDAALYLNREWWGCTRFKPSSLNTVEGAEALSSMILDAEYHEGPSKYGEYAYKYIFICGFDGDLAACSAIEELGLKIIAQESDCLWK